jgi:hypothetical protein
MSARGDYITDDDPPILGSSPRSQISIRSARKTGGGTWTAPSTPRGQRSRSQVSVGGSLGKRSGTPAAEYLRWAGPESPYSPSKSFDQVLPHDLDELDFELHAEGGGMSEDGFEGLENVRACCDGRHTVGHHHHHHTTPTPPQRTAGGNHLGGDPHLDAVSNEARPVSPAWSFRSRTASGNSHEGGTSMFSWGREDGRRLFGQRRSAKPIPTEQ